jgi:hypothetical protein
VGHRNFDSSQFFFGQLIRKPLDEGNASMLAPSAPDTDAEKVAALGQILR